MCSVGREDIYISNLCLENQTDNTIPKHPVMFIHSEKVKLKKRVKYVI